MYYSNTFVNVLDMDSGSWCIIHNLTDYENDCLSVQYPYTNIVSKGKMNKIGLWMHVQPMTLRIVKVTQSQTS